MVIRRRKQLLFPVVIQVKRGLPPSLKRLSACLFRLRGVYCAGCPENEFLAWSATCRIRQNLEALELRSGPVKDQQ